MKKLFFFMLLPVLAIGQTAIPFSFNGEAIDDLFGSTVSLSKDGTTLAVGATGNDGAAGAISNVGSVRVYRKLAGTWTQIGADIDGEATLDGSGTSVSLSTDGNTVAIGAIGNDSPGANAGHVRVYGYDGTAWVQKGMDIDGEAGADTSGRSVSLSGNGNIVAIGAPQNDPLAGAANANAGQVRVYQFAAGAWSLLGAEINGLVGSATTNGQDWFGFSVSLSTDGTILSAGGHTGFGGFAAAASGQTRVFKFSSGAWTQLGATINAESGADQSGKSVAISGDGTVLAIGAINNDAGSGVVSDNYGHVRLYKDVNGVWTKIGDDIDGEAIGDQSSSSISLSNDGNTIAIGAQNNDPNALLANAGSVRVYRNVEGTWKKLGIDIDGLVAGDANGISVSLSSDGNTLAIGAQNNDAGGSNAGTVSLWDLTNAVLSSDSFVLANFSVYPNPASDVVTISLQEGLQLEKVNIYNTLGQLVKTETKNVISVNTLVKGSYFFEVISNKGKATKKVLVQ